MPVPSYELARLDPNTFEHFVNSLVRRVLGSGHTGFSPGPDGGRDGYFEGPALYPSPANRWNGRWYIQSKFLAANLGVDPQKWLMARINEEIEEFQRADSRREWPDNWIIISNVNPSGASKTGSFDKARAAVKRARPKLASRFHIWGGDKVLDFISEYPDVARYYFHLISPGQVLSAVYEGFTDAHATIDSIMRYFIVTQFLEQQYTKLEQAGSTADNRPGIHKLFADLPFYAPMCERRGLAALELTKTLAENHLIAALPPADIKTWKSWQQVPSRSRIWFVRGGPGQGKSTLTQYVCQIQRASIILGSVEFNVLPGQRQTAQEICEAAKEANLWPLIPRIPVVVDLKEFARWLGDQVGGATRRLIGFLDFRLRQGLGEEIKIGTLKRAFGASKWLFVFDGLDEVPGDVKDVVANEVMLFSNDTLVGCNADAVIVCTSRPQGYSGQFNELNAAKIELSPLSKEQALACAIPLLALDRSASDREAYLETLQGALQSAAIAEIMTTPLQAHIMAVIVRDGGRPPERRWQLYNTFYQVIKKREANRNLPNEKLATLLREGDKLL